MDEKTIPNVIRKKRITLRKSPKEMNRRKNDTVIRFFRITSGKIEEQKNTNDSKTKVEEKDDERRIDRIDRIGRIRNRIGHIKLGLRI